MLPRKKLDIGGRDLFVAAFRCFWPSNAELARQNLEADWKSGHCENIVACLSVRTGFDLLLTALALPRGSEIVFSAVNIRDMVRLAQEHGLVAVPVDVDIETLSVSAADLERLLTPRTRAVVIAHLFGSRMPLEEIAELCERRNLLLVEDCAQAYAGNAYRGHPGAHVRMFSFGPIKTNTALGGALIGFRDPELAGMVRGLEARLPSQRRLDFLVRVLKYATVKMLERRPLFTLFVAACRVLGRSHDEVISAAVRGFAGPDFFDRIRRRPSYPLLALLRRRLNRFDAGSIAARVATAEAAIVLLTGVPRPGSQAAVHSHWLFPIRTPDPDRLMSRLWNAGLDATRGTSSLHVIEPPPDRAEAAPRRSAAGMSEVLYLPVYPGVPTRALERLAAEVVSSRDLVGAARS